MDQGSSGIRDFKAEISDPEQAEEADEAEQSTVNENHTVLNFRTVRRSIPQITNTLEMQMMQKFLTQYEDSGPIMINSTDDFDPWTNSDESDDEQRTLERTGRGPNKVFLSRPIITDIPPFNGSWTRCFLRMPDDRNYAVNSGGPIHVDGVEVPWPGYVASAGPMVDWIVVTSWPAASGREAWRQVFVASVLRDENFQTGDPLDIRLGFADHPFLFPTLRYGGRWVPAVYPTIAAGYYSPYLDELGLLLPAAETELVEAVHDACDEHDATSWCNLLVLTAAMHPHPDDHARLRTRLPYGALPGRASAVRAVRRVLGPRGWISGWPRPMPNVAYAALNAAGQIPQHWFPDPGTDGDSEWDGYSPGGGDSGDDGYRPGVTCDLIPVTDSSCSCESDPEVQPRNRLHVLRPGTGLTAADRSKLKDFDAYLRTYHLGRRIRRLGRRARREARDALDGQPVDEQELAELQSAAGREARRKCIELWHRDVEVSGNHRAVHKVRRHIARLKDARSISFAMLRLIEQLTTLRLLNLRLTLRWQTFETWKHFYCDPVDAPPLKLFGWLSPVKLPEQNEVCCGETVLMSLRPLTFYEAAIGDTSTTTSDIFDNYLEITNATDRKGTVDDSLKYRLHLDWLNYVGALEPCCVRKLIEPPTYEALKIYALMLGYSNYDQVLDVMSMTDLMNLQHTGRYKIKLIDRVELIKHERPLAQQFSATSNNSEDRNTDVYNNDDVIVIDDNNENNHYFSPIPEEGRLGCSEPNDWVSGNNERLQAYTGDRFVNTNDEVENRNESMSDLSTDDFYISGTDPLWSCTLVNQLKQGFLIAICLDIDASKNIPIMNGGKNAHWALLCGVIIGKPYDEIEENPSTCPSSCYVNYPHEPVRMNFDDMDDSSDDETLKLDKNWNDDTKDYCLCETGELKVDPQYVWVFVKHGNPLGNYNVWPLLDVIKSNNQIGLTDGNGHLSLSANKYISFEPVRQPKTVTNNIHCSKPFTKIDPLSPVQLFFSMKSHPVPFKPIGMAALRHEIVSTLRAQTNGPRTSTFMPQNRRFWRMARPRRRLRRRPVSQVSESESMLHRSTEEHLPRTSSSSRQSSSVEMSIAARPVSTSSSSCASESG